MVAYELMGTIFGCAPERGTTILMAYIKVCTGGACDHGTNHVISKYRLLKNKTSIYLVVDLSISFLKNAQTNLFRSRLFKNKTQIYFVH